MENEVLLESIIHFQSVESFEESTDLVYEDLSDAELFEALEQWYCTGEHDTNWYDAEDINTNFLGYEHKNHGETFLLSRYEEGLVIGLSRIIETRNKEGNNGK